MCILKIRETELYFFEWYILSVQAGKNIYGVKIIKLPSISNKNEIFRTQNAYFMFVSACNGLMFY